MSWITMIWSMNAAVCLTLAAINLLVWLHARGKWAYLFFSAGAVSVAIIAIQELLAMHSTKPENFAGLVRWAHVPMFVLFISLVGFTRIYLRAGRLWLGWTVIGVRLGTLGLNFFCTYNLNYATATGLNHFTFLGENVVTLVGDQNPLVIVGRMSCLLLLAYLIDASITVWRRGERSRAISIGGSLIFCILVAVGDSVVVESRVFELPYMVSFSYLGLILVMAYELSRDVLRASRLVLELQESEERLSLATEAAKLGLWVRDFSRDEIWATARWRALFGFSPTEQVPFEALLQRMHPDDRKVFHQNFEKAMAGGGSYETEYRLLLPDGQTRWISSRGQVEFNGGGRPKLLRGVSVDITDRKQSEMEVQLRRNELTHLSRVTMLGELSGSMAHELNQPLASILYNAEAALALLDQNPADIAEVRETLKDILVEDRRAGEVIRRLRLLLTKGEVQRQPLDLNEIVQEVLKLVRVDLVSRGVAVQTELATALPAVHADRIQLQQVLLNLVINGCDAMANDAPDDRQLVMRSGRTENDGLWVSVGDRGQGLSPGNLEKIFDPFFTTKSRGMGLGLSVCRTIISAHGGKLWATNNDGPGATFRFSLPVSGMRHDAATSVP